jgi:signal transduction histidine kinase
MSSEPTRIVETLKEKAILLLQREHQLRTLDLARERTSAWLQVFHRLSVEIRPEVDETLCNEWARLMIRELHFQTAAAFRLEANGGGFHLVAGQSHSPLPRSIQFDAEVLGFLEETREGSCKDPEDPVLRTFARALGLQRFLWSLLPGSGCREHLLIVGFSSEAAAFQPYSTEADFGYFRMLARHVSVLLNNSHLIAELDRERLQLRVMNAQYAEANQELEAFSYSVSHDLRAPLRSIDGFTQILLEDYANKLDPQAQGYAQRVRAAAQRMGELIDDLLQLARVSRAEVARQRVDLSGLARTVVAEFMAKDPERRVEVVVGEGLFADADPHLARVVLDNLLGNAWKFTMNAEHPQIEVGAMQHEDQQTYFVRDNGAGFSMKYVEKLFRPFQRLHTVAEYPGTGIGLATVRRVIDRHRGRIWAEGTIGQGATFFFTLPAVEQRA